MQETIRSDIPRGKFDPRLPAGMMAMFAGTVAPRGWLFCDGSAVSRTGYAALFAAMGTAFGSGDGSTTFNLPDMRGKAPIGVGQDSGHSLTSRTLGTFVGEENHLLTIAEMPSHTHAETTNTGSGSTSAIAKSTTLSTTTSAIATTTQSTGGGGSHNTMQPSMPVNFIVKT